MFPPWVREANQAELNDRHLSKDLLTFERDRQRLYKRKDRRKGKWRCRVDRHAQASETLRKGSGNLRWLTSFDKVLVLDDASGNEWPTDTKEKGIVDAGTQSFSPRLSVTLLDIARPARPTKLKGLAKDFLMIPSLPRVLDWKDSEVVPVPVDDWEML